MNLYHTVTPVTMLRMVLRMEPMAALRFFFCSHILNLKAFLLALDLPLKISIGMCLKDCVRVPNLPLTTTFLAFTSTSTPSGIYSSCSDEMYFITKYDYKY